ncbi:MAG: hypothetical protein NT018_00880 [Armatimonadetes bacterium]|nr:hypothetical protein [Armatimonadota bacterium]
MKRLSEDEFAQRTNGRVNSKPRCERCGRPIRISKDDYERDEILCPICASDVKASSMMDPDFDGSI